MAFQRQTEALGFIQERQGWDQETMMPRAAAEQRGEEMAALEAVLHARRTDARIGDWLEAAEVSDDGRAGASAADPAVVSAQHQGAGRSGRGIGAHHLHCAGHLGGRARRR